MQNIQSIKDDIISIGDIVENNTFSLRIKYDCMKLFFSEHMVSRYSKIVLFFNLNSIVSKAKFKAIHAYKFESLNKQASLVVDDGKLILDEKDLIPYQINAILNTISHYNHFFYHHCGTQPISTVLYFPTPEGYTTHEDLINTLTATVKFIPQVHVAGRINSSIIPYQTHVPSAIMRVLKKELDVRRKETVVLMLNPSLFDWQMNQFVNRVYGVNPSNNTMIYTWGEYISQKLSLPIQLFESSMNLGLELRNAYPAILALKRGSIKDFIPLKFPKITARKTAFFDKLYNPQPELIRILREYGHDSFKCAEALFDYVVSPNTSSPEIKSMYLNLVRAFDFNTRKDVVTIVQQMLPFWTQKLKDKSIASTLSETLTKAKGSQSVNIEWLLEGISHGNE